MDLPGKAELLIAASPGGAREITASLEGQVPFVLATDYEDALRRLRERRFRLIVVGYYFDNARPFRFIQEARSLSASTAVLLVRALPLPPLGATTEEEIRAAYQHFGVEQFFNFHASLKEREVEERQRLFRNAVVQRLLQ